MAPTDTKWYFPIESFFLFFFPDFFILGEGVRNKKKSPRTQRLELDLRYRILLQNESKRRLHAHIWS